MEKEVVDQLADILHDICLDHKRIERSVEKFNSSKFLEKRAKDLLEAFEKMGFERTSMGEKQ